MKKIVLLVMLGMILVGFHASAQNNLTVIDVGGVKIKFPNPNKDFKKINIDKEDVPYDITTFFDKVIEAFIDTVNAFHDTTYYLNKYNEKILYSTFNKLMVIGYFSEIDEDNYDNKGFLKLKKHRTFFKIRNKKQIIDSIFSFYKDTSNIKKFKIDDKLKEFGLIYETKDAFSIICGNFLILKNETIKLIAVLNYLRVKNKIIHTITYCKYDGLPSISNITDLSESWAKAILDANK